MIVVIIAGGSGTRLWPLSVGSYPKHLLKLVGDRTGVQAAYDRARKLTDKIYVVTEQSHDHHVKEQLPDLADSVFIVEPARRGTASCIVAALQKIYADGHDAEEPIAFHWADHAIRDIDGFAHAFRTAGAQSKKHRRITLVGIEPVSASTAFGYIEKGSVIDEDAFCSEVASFKEKPNKELALEFLRSGRYLWNGGYLVGSVNVFLEAFAKVAPERRADFDKLTNATDATAYNDVYSAFTNEAIDYVLNEKMDNLLVVPATFDWRDIGSFTDLSDATETDDAGNAVIGEGSATIDVTNSYIRNETNEPVAVIGLDNIVVVKTAHGVLVTRKDMSQKVKDIVTRLAEKQAKTDA